MKIEVLYFAALRERLGTARETLDVETDVRTVGDLRAMICARGEPWSSAFAETRRMRVAVNQTMAAEDSPLVDGAEVAFFPPVTGG